MNRTTISALLVSLALVPSVAACSGGGGASDSTSSGDTHASTSSSSSSPSASKSASEAVAGEPKTLEAAVKAQQETTDRFTSGDYAGAWDGYSAAFQKGISREDYDQLGKTCDGGSGPGIPIKVKGVRLEGADKAIVRLTFGDYGQSRTMSYENGHWKQEPNPDFAKELGKPLAQIIAAEKAAGACNGGK